MKKLFPQKPEDLSAVPTDELQSLLDEIGTVAASIQDGSADLTELGATDEERAAEVITQMREAKELKTEIQAVIDGREGSVDNFVEDMTELAAELTATPEAPAAEATLAAETDPEPDPEPDPAPDPEPDPEPDAQPQDLVTLATAEPAAPRSYALPATPKSHDTPETAVAQVLGAAPICAVERLETSMGRYLAPGTPLTRDTLADAFLALAKRTGPVKHRAGGGEERFSLAAVTWTYDDSVVLHAGDPEGNMQKIIAMGSPFFGPEGVKNYATETRDGMVAAGGICAPPTPYYDPPGFASRARPVRDSLPTLNAPRGGVSVPSVAVVDRSDSGVTVIEESEDAQGGTFSVKACRTVPCATWTDTFVGIISHCLEVGNLNAITWPEGVALENDNLMAGWAATADTRLLNRLKALSIRVTDVAVYNAVHGLLYAMLRAKSSIKSVLRSDDAIGFTVVMPEWVPAMLASDMAAQSAAEERYRNEAAIRAFLGNQGISVFFYKDTPTTDESQLVPLNVTGTPLKNFPSVVQWGIWINGQFARLDTGSLELGLIRDSTLNETNDYQLFGESFENVAKIGPDEGAVWVRSTLCPDGTFPALQTALSC